ncbi:hypothetical protein QYE76_026292 [Lolium multiflorum]|uniref:F-box domain-containing protein n=1 Tax=Lolium multiflorum TaxID=4521 RepID=A0AAD8RFX9_LOLMU|nr:hypothetical protein QYE76_026292 [Lolium multiflorum]
MARWYASRAASSSSSFSDKGLTSSMPMTMDLALSRKLSKLEDDASAADDVSKVLGDDDLLAEILLRVGLPTTLVHAAAACKRWLHHASDKAFLRCYHKLNPPRLLGFYTKIHQGAPRFVPMLDASSSAPRAVRRPPMPTRTERLHDITG